MNKKQKKVLKRIIVAAVLLVIIGIAGSVVSIPKWLEFLFYLVPYFVIGYDILRKAWKGICNRQMFDENFLMAVATIGAIALGDYKEGVAVMLFYQIGELFQSYAVGKSRRTIWRPSRLCCSTRWANGSSLMLWARAAGISVI